MIRPYVPPPDRRGEAGFSLIEALVTLALTVLLILAVLAVFDANARISRVQTDVADMQQNQRVAQYEITRQLRMAGRGGLPQGPVPLGLATSVRNNVGADEYISPGDDTTPEVLDGTDVLTVRGVFGRIYQVDPINVQFNPPGGPYTTGTITLTNPSNTGVPQNLQPLLDALYGGECTPRPQALVLVSPLSDQSYAVLEMDPATTTLCADGGGAANTTIGVTITGGAHTDDYLPMSGGGGFGLGISGAAYLGVLEEYRYYIREVRAGGRLFPVLSRARVFPGTETPVGGAADWSVDIAENVFDLQVAYGVDGNGDGLIVDANLPNNPLVNPNPPGSADADEWLFNHPDDDVTDAVWNNAALYYLRVTNLVRSHRADRGYQAPILLFVEDHAYGGSFLNLEEERSYRRRSLVTRVDLRNQ